MRRVELVNIAEVTAGQGAPQKAGDFSSTGKPFIRAGSLEKLINGEKEEHCELVSTETAEKYSLRLFPPGTILFAKSGMSAKLDRIYQLKNYAYVVNHLAAIIPYNGVNSAYLRRWFEKNPPSRLVANDAYPSIRLKDLETLTIDIPEDEKEQIRISFILDKADSIRQKRRETLRLADEFLRSTFFEMFGDPLVNFKDEKNPCLGDFVNITMGQSPSGESYNSIGYGMPLLNGPAEFGEKYPKEKQWTTQPTKIASEGEILFCVRGATAGRMNWANKEYCIGRGLASLSTKGEISNEYIYFYLKRMYDYFQSTSAGSTFINVGKDALYNLKFQFPDNYRDVKFSKIFNEVEILKEKYIKSLQESENLFNSLMQRAFRGEL